MSKEEDWERSRRLKAEAQPRLWRNYDAEVAEKLRLDAGELSEFIWGAGGQYWSRTVIETYLECLEPTVLPAQLREDFLKTLRKVKVPKPSQSKRPRRGRPPKLRSLWKLIDQTADFWERDGRAPLLKPTPRFGRGTPEGLVRHVVWRVNNEALGSLRKAYERVIKQRIGKQSKVTKGSRSKSLTGTKLPKYRRL